MAALIFSLTSCVLPTVGVAVLIQTAIYFIFPSSEVVSSKSLWMREVLPASQVMFSLIVSDITFQALSDRMSLQVLCIWMDEFIL